MKIIFAIIIILVVIELTLPIGAITKKVLDVLLIIVTICWLLGMFTHLII